MLQGSHGMRTRVCGSDVVISQCATRGAICSKHMGVLYKSVGSHGTQKFLESEAAGRNFLGDMLEMQGEKMPKSWPHAGAKTGFLGCSMLAAAGVPKTCAGGGQRIESNV